jgi:hypothetical protein
MDERSENELMSSTESNNDNQDDGTSQSSQRSLGGRSASLLERIQRQRELEATTTTTAGAAQATSNDNTNSSTIPSVPQPHLLPQPNPIQVPQYGPMPGFGNTTTQPPATAPIPKNGYLNNAWSSFTQNMESTMMADKSQLNLSQSYDNDEMHHALLPPTSGNDYTNMGQTADEYSISQYFLTFVKDIYGLFIWLPIAVRIVVVAGLLYVVVKFI